jgi:hypothetical protein
MRENVKALKCENVRRKFIAERSEAHMIGRERKQPVAENDANGDSAVRLYILRRW